MGEFGFNLLTTVEVQVGILQHFVLTAVVTEETPVTTAIARPKDIFATKLLPW